MDGQRQGKCRNIDSERWEPSQGDRMWWIKVGLAWEKSTGLGNSTLILSGTCEKGKQIVGHWFPTNTHSILSMGC